MYSKAVVLNRWSAKQPSFFCTFRQVRLTEIVSVHAEFGKTRRNDVWFVIDERTAYYDVK